MKKKVQVPCRAHVFYSGRVQGVGFRYTVERFALDLKLCGFVKNLSDGRVELVCEGPKQKIDELLLQVKESNLGPHIKKADCAWEDPAGQFDDFTVEFSL